MTIRGLLSPTALRRLRRIRLVFARALGLPVSSPREAVNRPRLDRRRERMRLSHVLMACDTSRAYLDFWPNAAACWEELIGLEPVLVLIAREEDVPAELAADRRVVRFEPVDGLHTTFQAQCIRLLYPALIGTQDAVIITDIDLYPFRASYFHEPVAPLDARFFVSYRDARLHRREIDIMFNAARPATWAEVFGAASLAEVRARLSEWGAGLEYHGGKAWPGWYTDQRVLYEKLTSWPDAPQRHWLLDDDYCRYNRLNRDVLSGPHLSRRERSDLMRGRYTDYNCFVPYDEYREFNDLVLRLGREAALRR